MTAITDEYMQQMISATKKYSLVILKTGPNCNMEDARKIIWEHGRRNFALRAEGLLPIVCPVTDGKNVHGIGIFNVSMDEVKKIMDEDPGVKEGIFLYEIYECRGFPGSSLP